MARRLLDTFLVDRAVISTATELFDAGHYPGVVAVCSDALEDEPECVPLLVIRARAHIALRRDLDAQADLRDIIRLEPRCGIAYRLLGELAARRDENESAAIFFREALRLDPDDAHARDWLQVVAASVGPAAAAARLPASAAVAGRFLRARAPGRPAPGMVVHIPPRVASVPARSEASAPVLGGRQDHQPRFARGTHPPDPAERTTPPRGASPQRQAKVWDVRTMTPWSSAEPPPVMSLSVAEPPRPAAAQLPPPVMERASLPELPGFGDYLVSVGILTLRRLRAAQAYQRSMNVQLVTAIVALGLATPQRLEWAAVVYQSQRAHAAAAS